MVIDERGTVGLVGCPVPAAGPEPVRGDAAADKADHAGRQHDVGEGHVQRKDGDKGGCGHGPQHPVIERPGANAVGGKHDDGGYRGLDAIQHPGHHGHIAEGQVDPGQRDQDRERRQHEQRAGHDAAQRAVHQPADVGRQLLGLGPGQHHGVVQRMQETVLADPAPAFHQFGMHHGDLAGRTAEADEAELEPVEKRLAQRDGSRLWCFRRRFGNFRHAAYLVMPSSGDPVHREPIFEQQGCRVSSPGVDVARDF